MARAKLSALITSLAGRYGGGVFRNWKGTTVLSALPSAVANPATAKQEEARAVFSYASKFWAGLASGVRDQWRAVAAALSAQWENSENSIGERQLIYPPRGPFTALGAITSVCSLLASVSEFDTEDAIPSAPVGIGAPVNPILGTISGDTTAGLTVTWTDPGSWGEDATAGAVRVFVKSEDGNFHTQKAAVVAAGTETATITELTPRGGSHPVPLVLGVYLVQLDAINLEGLRSAPSAVDEFDLPAAV